MSDVFSKRREHLLKLKALRNKEAEPTEQTVYCAICGGAQSAKLLEEQHMVCTVCGYHNPIGAYVRLHTLLDSGTFKEINERLSSSDPLDFPDYKRKLKNAKQNTGLSDAVVTATGKIDGHKVAVGVLDGRFLMGSMNTVVGEKITRLVELATRTNSPLIIFSASGGARMQEGIFSLMQMAKTSAAVERFSQKGGLFISVMTHPTTGGVTASYASLGDIMLAEPGALIGFAGPRVIEQTIGQTLPEGFQTAEYLLEHGFLDAIVHRSDMRNCILQLLNLHVKGAMQDE